VPPTVTIPAGQTSATFSISTAGVTGDLSANLTAAADGSVAKASLSVTTGVASPKKTPPPAAPTKPRGRG